MSPTHELLERLCALEELAAGRVWALAEFYVRAGASIRQSFDVALAAYDEGILGLAEFFGPGPET